MSVLLTAILAAEMFAMAQSDISSSRGCATLPELQGIHANEPGRIKQRKFRESHLPAVALLSSIPKHCRGTNGDWVPVLTYLSYLHRKD